jgi:hypothetical protein
MGKAHQGVACRHAGNTELGCNGRIDKADILSKLAALDAPHEQVVDLTAGALRD